MLSVDSQAVSSPPDSLSSPGRRRLGVRGAGGAAAGTGRAGAAGLNGARATRAASTGARQGAELMRMREEKVGCNG